MESRSLINTIDRKSESTPLLSDVAETFGSTRAKIVNVSIEVNSPQPDLKRQFEEERGPYKCEDCDQIPTSPSYWEQRVWDVVKKIPLICILYGLVRGSIYLCKGDPIEGFGSYFKALGGLVEVAIFTFIPMLLNPFLNPWVGGLLVVIGASIGGQVVGGGGEILVEFCRRGKSKTSGENVGLYNSIIKDIAFIGGICTTIKGIYYCCNGDKRRNENFVHGFFNILGSTVAAAICGYFGFQKFQEHRTGLKAVVASANPSINAIPKIMSSVSGAVGTFARASGAVVGKGVSESIFKALILNIMNMSCRLCIPTVKEAVIVMREMQVVERYRKARVDPEKFAQLLIQHVGCRKDENEQVKEAKFEYLSKCVIKSSLNFPMPGDQLVSQFNLDNFTEDCLQSGNIRLALSILAFLPIDSPILGNLEMSTRKNERKVIEYLVRNIFFLKNRPKYVYYPFPLNIDLEQNPELQQYVLHSNETISTVSDRYKGGGKRFLCLDGGGIRGCVSTEILQRLEFLCQTSIKNCFDYMVGTSIGGIIILALAMGHSLDEIKKLFFQLKDEIFKNQKPYNNSKFEEILQNFFGTDTTMADIQGVKVVVFATYRTRSNTMEIKSFSNLNPETLNVKIWEAARCTSAAPGFFDPMELTESSENQVEYIDGGLMANNPTEHFLKSIEKKELRNGIVVSVGTGIQNNPKNRPFPRIREGLGGVLLMCVRGDLADMKDILVKLATRTDGSVVQGDALLCEAFQSAYWRFTPQLSTQKISLDETADVKILNMIVHTKAYINQNHEKLEQVARILVQK